MKFRINTKSIRFRVWMYLLLFTVVLMLLMWILQIVFINTYYKDMKIDSTKETVTLIASAYKSRGLKEAQKEAETASEGNDIYVVITNGDETVFSTNSAVNYDILGWAEERFEQRSSDDTASEGIKEGDTANNSVYYYAELLDKNSTKTLPGKDETDNPEAINDGDPNDALNTGPQTDQSESNTVLYVFSPLYPVASTINIMQKQLGYIMFISLILAFFISLLLTRRISNPIVDITRNAQKLADGQYGINFPVDTSSSEITDLAETLNKMSNELERSSLMQRDLMANVSHDLRTPLTMIKSYAEMIRDLSGDNPEKRSAHLNVIIEESDRLNSLVNDMLALTAMQAGTLSIDVQPFNIYSAMDSVLAPYKVLEEKEGYDIRFNCKEDMYVEGDEERIKQVMSNLLSNGVKYCGTDKTVIINIRRWGKKVHFEVVDHGVGIKPEELSHIWERYYKTSSNHVRPTRGSGLGLSIVKEILQLHEAKFGVESKVGKGTTVWFELKTASRPIRKDN